MRRKLDDGGPHETCTDKMATFRISSKQINAISLHDEKTWPVDLQVWVELTARHRWKSWYPPFYLSHEQVKIFREKALKLKKPRSNSH